MKKSKKWILCLLLICVQTYFSPIEAKAINVFSEYSITTYNWNTPEAINQKLIKKDTNSIYVEYIVPGKSKVRLAKYDQKITDNTVITRFRNSTYQVSVFEIDRGDYVEINGELESFSNENTCITLRVVLPFKGKEWRWYKGLDASVLMDTESVYKDTKEISTVLPPDGAFNGATLSDGGYGDSIGLGTMSYYPLCAINIDSVGMGLGIDMSIPMVYRLSGEKNKGLIAEFDVATSPLTAKFPNRAFFKLVQFNFNSDWGMRAALKRYYEIFPKAFKKRVITEGAWLPFTALRSIKNWEDFGFAYHEISWRAQDKINGKALSNIESDKGTGVFSFQYTEPWDTQLPILKKDIPYDSIISDKMIPNKHKEYIESSATEDKNGLLQARRLKTPWFSSGWAVSITTNSDPDISGFNRGDYVYNDEIFPALALNVDGVYFDSMEWNWHHDLNYRTEHFKFTDFPLVFSKDVKRPAIWNFISEFEFMKKVADEMHSQGKLVMGNGHGWNPFAATNLDLFGAELSWYSDDAHNTEALDFKRAISFQKPIVFLLNEGLNDKAFAESPFIGYEIYFEKLLAYGFFPSFFSIDASSDPYWNDAEKIENGRPFFKKYIPIIRKISEAGWEPITAAFCANPNVRIERFGKKFFTIRNNGEEAIECVISIDLEKLKIPEGFLVKEMVSGQNVKVNNNKIFIDLPAERTRLIQIF